MRSRDGTRLAAACAIAGPFDLRGKRYPAEKKPGQEAGQKAVENRQRETAPA
jgi:hypothetical protein